MIEKSPKLDPSTFNRINWNLENYSLLKRLIKLSGIDENGYNTDVSVRTGCVHVPVCRQQELEDYKKAWKDLDITYDTIITRVTNLKIPELRWNTVGQTIC